MAYSGDGGSGGAICPEGADRWGLLLVDGDGFERAHALDAYVRWLAFVVELAGAGTIQAEIAAVHHTRHRAGANDFTLYVGGLQLVGVDFTGAHVADIQFLAFAPGVDAPATGAHSKIYNRGIDAASLNASVARRLEFEIKHLHVVGKDGDSAVAGVLNLSQFTHIYGHLWQLHDVDGVIGLHGEFAL